MRHIYHAAGQAFGALGLLLLSAAAAPAGEPITYTVQEDYEDVLFSLESEIINRGLVIDNVSKVGKMLDRTGADIGATTTIFTGAQVFSFCSATLSRKVMEIDPANVAYCPYTIFAYATPDRPGETVVGFTDYPEGEMKEVEDFLNDIVRTALELD